MSLQNRRPHLMRALLATTAAGALALLCGSAGADVSVGFSYFDIDRADDFDAGATSLSIGATFGDGASYGSFGASTINYSTSYVQYGFGRSYSYFNSCRPRVFYGCTSYTPVFAHYDPFCYRPVVTYPLYSTYGYVTPSYATAYVDPYCAPTIFAPSYAPVYAPAPVYCAPAYGYYPASTYAYYRPSYSFGISISFGFGHYRPYRHYSRSYYDCYDPYQPIYCPPSDCAPFARSRHRDSGRGFAQVGPAPTSPSIERAAFAPVGDGRVAFQRPSVESRGQMGPTFNPGPSTISPGAMKSLASAPIADNGAVVARPMPRARPDAPGIASTSNNPRTSSTPTPTSNIGPRPAMRPDAPANTRPQPIAKTEPGAFKPMGPVMTAPSAAGPDGASKQLRPISSVTPAAKPMPLAGKPVPQAKADAPAPVAKPAPIFKQATAPSKPAAEGPRMTITPSTPQGLSRPSMGPAMGPATGPAIASKPAAPVAAPVALPRRDFAAPVIAPKVAPSVAPKAAPAVKPEVRRMDLPAKAPVVAPSKLSTPEFRQAPVARPTVSTSGRETREARPAPAAPSAPRAQPQRQGTFKPVERSAAPASRPTMGPSPAPRQMAAPKSAPAMMKPATPARMAPISGKDEKRK
ncbi:MAG: hypothetical protein ACT4PL_09420 [Phycisphaerales bacterium]